MPERFAVDLGFGETVTALAYRAATRPGATLVLAHGAGAGQNSEFMVGFAQGLSARDVETITFNFKYTERGRRVPDRPEELEACYRAVLTVVRERARADPLPLLIGGKSLGGRIASHVASDGDELARTLAGLVFLGYPLHPPGKPEQRRVEHLATIRVPMLFVQGSRDSFGMPDELRPVLAALSTPTQLHVVGDGDHSLKLPKRSSQTQGEVDAAVQDLIAKWISTLDDSGGEHP